MHLLDQSRLIYKKKFWVESDTNGIVNITIPDLTALKPVAIGSLVIVEAAKAASATGGVIADATAK